MLLATFGILYFSSRDYIFKENPDVSQSTKINKVIKDRTFGAKKEFNMALGIFNEKFEPI